MCHYAGIRPKISVFGTFGKPCGFNVREPPATIVETFARVSNVPNIASDRDSRLGAMEIGDGETDYFWTNLGGRDHIYIQET